MIASKKVEVRPLFSFSAEKDLSGNITNVNLKDITQVTWSYYEFYQNLMIKRLKQECIYIADEHPKKQDKSDIGFRYVLPDG